MKNLFTLSILFCHLHVSPLTILYINKYLGSPTELSPVNAK